MDVHTHLPLTPREFHLLLALADEARNGYQLSQRVEETSGGTVRLSPATQYTNLHRLVEQGLVEEVTEEVAHRTDGRGQRFWHLTALGRRVLQAEGRRLARDARLAATLVPER